jgi:hypothetical protein
MKFDAIVLYPGRLTSLAGRPGVRFRVHGKHKRTLVPCVLETVENRTVAKPAFAVPPETPLGIFHVQFEVRRVPAEVRQKVAIVMGAGRPAERMDPEQQVLAPIYDDRARMIYEFTRAYILIVGRGGEVELRLVAIHPRTGVLGTTTVYRSHVRYAPLMLRCQEYLAGTIELFPEPVRQERPLKFRELIPSGVADLTP